MNENRVGLEKRLNVELKYCEWCGGLWLRKAREMEALCPQCRCQIDVLPKLFGAKLKHREAGRRAVRNGYVIIETPSRVTRVEDTPVTGRGGSAC